MTKLIELPVPESALPTASPRDLLAQALGGLNEAPTMRTEALRYGAAHLAAMRAAAALLAARATAARNCQQGPAYSVWYLAKQVAPELERELEYWASQAVGRAGAAEGFLTFTETDAARAIQDATEFVTLVTRTLSTPETGTHPEIDQIKANLRAAQDEPVSADFPWKCTRCGMPVREKWETARRSYLVDRFGRSGCFEKRGRHKV